jgi:hypothetical protein
MKRLILILLSNIFIVTFLLANQDDFITTWKTTSDNESITIPTTGSGYNYDVDWGDGTTTTGETGDATHTYVSTDTYTVIISGDFPRIYFNNSGDKDKIYSIDQWGIQEWTSMEKAFYGCSNLVGQANDSPDLSSVASVYSMFQYATSFNQDIGEYVQYYIYGKYVLWSIIF